MILPFEDVTFRLFGFLWADVDFNTRGMVLVSISLNNLITKTLISIFCGNLERIIPFLLIHWIDLFHIFHNNHLVRVGRSDIFQFSLLFEHNWETKNWIFFHRDLD